MKDFKYELSHEPDLPGVYLMKDKDEKIICRKRILKTGKILFSK